MFFILSEILWIYILQNNRFGLSASSYLLFLVLGWLFMGIIGITLDVAVIGLILLFLLILLFIIFAVIHERNVKKNERESNYGKQKHME
jgi:Ca2+/Na+ antiporter